MSQNQASCRDCGVPMQVGYLLDMRGDRIHWIEGLPHITKLFGIDTGMVKTQGHDHLEMLAYRCPQCGEARFFAVSADTPRQ